MKKRKRLNLDFEIRKLTKAILKGGSTRPPQPNDMGCVRCDSILPCPPPPEPTTKCRCRSTLVGIDIPPQPL
jgi:hypothetical protein